MKKLIFIALIFLLFYSVSAQTNVSDLLSNSSVQNRTNQILEKNVEIPNELQIVARILFGLENNEKIDLQTFIILIALWFFIYLLIVSIIQIMPFLQDGKSWIVGFLIMLLVGFSGGLTFAAFWIYSISGLFGLLQQLAIARLIVTVLILTVLFFIFSKFIASLKGKMQLEEAAQVGRNISFASFMGKIFKESAEEKN